MNLPKAWKLSAMIGPSLIVLGVGLGSGELIMWPYLTANHGLSIAWAAILGITAQLIVNLEIERYALVTGESVFVGWARKFGNWISWWFLASTLIPWIWPGIAASAATVFARAVGLPYSGWWGVGVLILIGIIYSAGTVVYKTQELVQKLIIFVGVPFIVGLTIWLVTQHGDIGQIINALYSGIGKIPQGISMSAFLAALVYSGAGGNLNLAQSLYVKEKGYGMGKYSSKLHNVLTDSVDKNYKLTGQMFTMSKDNLTRYRDWWKQVNIEHTLVFWLTGVITIIFLMTLSFVTAYGQPQVQSGIKFVLLQSEFISQRSSFAFGTLFLVMVGLMLLGTQFSVYGSNARMATENLLIGTSLSTRHVSKYFYGFLWLQILAGITVFTLGYIEPLALVIAGAVLNAVSMGVYCSLLIILNLSLPKPVQPSLLRVILMILICIGYSSFAGFTIWNYFRA